MNKVCLFLSSVPAGFPSPATDYVDRNLDLNEFLIKNKPATFVIKVLGDSMVGAGIFSGDYLIVDRSLKAVSGKVILAIINGEFTVKRFLQKGREVVLAPENNKYPDLVIKEEDSFEVWGVVTYVIHNPNQGA
jgi:DNA polymerase V